MTIPNLTFIAIACPLVCAPALLHAADPVVDNVVSTQRAGTKLVDISFDVLDADSDQLFISVEISDDGGATFVVPVSALSGDVIVSATPDATGHVLVWNAAIDFNQQFNDTMVVRVVAHDDPGLAPPPAGMVLIPAGSFLMGADVADNDGKADELPVHSVEISAFYIDKFEVTKALWDEVKTWGAANGYTDLPAGGGQGGIHPVQTVNWYAVVKWCNARSEMEGLAPTYYTSDTHIPANVYKTGDDDLAASEVDWSSSGYRLPTEAEWEKATRGGMAGKTYPWGNTIADGDANYGLSSDPFENGSAQTTPVGFYDGEHWSAFPTDRANGYGLYDIAGNVLEWCWDWYKDDWYSNPAAMIADTRGPASSPLGNRALRSGSWLFSSLDLRCANRDSVGRPDIEHESVGFRSVRGL